MYAQKVEGDSWKGEKLDKAKIDKMSGRRQSQLYLKNELIQCRSATWTIVRAHAGHPEERARRRRRRFGIKRSVLDRRRIHAPTCGASGSTAGESPFRNTQVVDSGLELYKKDPLSDCLSYSHHGRQSLSKLTTSAFARSTSKLTETQTDYIHFRLCAATSKQTSYSSILRSTVRSKPAIVVVHHARNKAPTI